MDPDEYRTLRISTPRQQKGHRRLSRPPRVPHCRGRPVAVALRRQPSGAGSGGLGGGAHGGRRACRCPDAGKPVVRPPARLPAASRSGVRRPGGEGPLHQPGVAARASGGGLTGRQAGAAGGPGSFARRGDAAAHAAEGEAGQPRVRDQLRAQGPRPEPASLRRFAWAGGELGQGLAGACRAAGDRPGQVPVLSRLASEFAVCIRWFCSVPGETWPNRNFAHAATSDGETQIEIRPYTAPTVFELLEDNGADWRIYHDDTPQAWAFPALWNTPERHAKWFPLDQFAGHVAAGELTAYTFIEPNHRPPLHTLDHAPFIGSPGVSNNQHPENNLVSDGAYDTFTPHGETDFTRAEQLIATIYEALRANPELFDKTVLLITYDEHGGLYDHVPPPNGVASPGGATSTVGALARLLFHRKTRAFGFTLLGPRVPAVVVSPRVPAGAIDAQVHDHASIPATLRALFAPGAPPLTRRDERAVPFHGLLTLPAARTDLPDLSTHAARLTAAVTGPPPPATLAPDAAAEPDGQLPPYYQPFIDLADQVQQQLNEVGEPETAGLPPAIGPVTRSEDISRAFAAAAARHRSQAAEPPATSPQGTP